MKTKIITSLIASFGFFASVPVSAATASLDANSTNKTALIDFTGTGSFSFDLLVTPDSTNTLKLTFAKPLVGSFNTLSYAFYDGATLLNTYTITSTAASTTFNDGAGAFSGSALGAIELSANHTYKLSLAGNVATTNSANFAQYKISTSNGTIAAVPEPESYAMFLAGLGIMGAVARRRSNLKK